MTQLTLLFNMLRIRRIEEAITKKYSSQKMRCPVRLSIGREATAVGVSDALEKADLIMSAYRPHAHYLAKGGNLVKLISELYGKELGCSMGRGGSTHLADLSVGMMGSTSISGGTIPVATGLAFASVLKNSKKLVVCFFEDESFEEGIFCECLSFASLKNLPIIFIYENYTGFTEGTQFNKMHIANSHGILTQLCKNGNDVEKVHATTKKAIHSIKNKNGPAYIEFEVPFIDPKDTLLEPDIENLPHLDLNLKDKKHCPLQRFIHRLLGEKILTKNILEEMELSIKEEIINAFERAKQSPYPIYEPSSDVAYANS